MKEVIEAISNFKGVRCFSLQSSHENFYSSFMNKIFKNFDISNFCFTKKFSTHIENIEKQMGNRLELKAVVNKSDGFYE